MRLTLLFDLDDTLLDTNLGEFVPAYFQGLAKHLVGWVSPDVMLPALMSGTQRMLENVDPSRTLQEVFDEEFYPRLGVPKSEIRGAIEDFYDRVFGGLSALTEQRPGARELIDWARAQGARLVLATDPLFPRKAIYERIRWAGLNPEAFELISSYETFHFTKSHPAYYAEILGRLGWPDGPVLMVGNDAERDLICAQELGLMTFQIDREPVQVPESRAAVSMNSRLAGRGTLEDLHTWLQSTDLEHLEPVFGNQASILAVLRSTPAVLQGLGANLNQPAWEHEPTPEDWAMIEIVCHLRDTEREVHHDQLRSLIEEAQPFVRRPDAAVWAKQRNYLGENGPRAVQEFAAARLGTLAMLQDLEPEIWNRTARHAIFGPTDFKEVVGFMADHDRLHVQQAWQTLKGPS